MNPKIRKLKQKLKAKATLEGAGVRLHRGFGYFELPKFDPFLLFDDFSSNVPGDYLPGFPWHPHRGIETVTYMLDGNVRHEDSIGNAGVISAGSVQWMTAGSGIVHQEMPEGYKGVKGFQLWVNLPKENKMTDPRYQEFRAISIPEVAIGKHAKARIIAGDADKERGPVKDIFAKPIFVDITLKANKSIDFPVVIGHTVFLYIFEGNLGLEAGASIVHSEGDVLLLEREGNNVHVQAGSFGARFLIVSGKPINEAIAWYGPIVMNTKEELETAFAQLQTGDFIAKK
jgi:hypothetical protein